MKWTQGRHAIHAKHLSNGSGVIYKAYCPNVRGQFIWCWTVSRGSVIARGWELTVKKAKEEAEKTAKQFLNLIP